MDGRYEIQQKEKESIIRIINGDPFLSGFEMFMSDMERIKSPVSRKNILMIIRQYMKFCSQEDCSNWDVLADIDNIMRFRRYKSVKQDGKEASTSYARGICYALNLFFKYGKIKKTIDSNPMDGYNVPILTDEPQREKLTREDFEKIIDAVKKGNRHQGWEQRDLLIMQLLMTCGMRETALVSINIDDIDLEDKTLILVDKGNRTHVYNIEMLIPQIEKWLKIRESLCPEIESKALFISSHKTRLTARALINIVAKYSVQGIGIKLSPHDIRAGVVTIAVDSGIPLATVSKYIGHKNVTTTSRYFISNREEMKSVAHSLAKNIL